MNWIFYKTCLWFLKFSIVLWGPMSMRIQGDLLSAIKLHIVLQRSICWKLSVGTLCLTFELVVKTFPICGLKKSFFCVFSAKSNIKPISIHLKDMYGHMTYGLSEIFSGNAILKTLILTMKNHMYLHLALLICLLNITACLYEILPFYFLHIKLIYLRFRTSILKPR